MVHQIALWQELTSAISRVTGSPFTIERRESLAGGCIHSVLRICQGKGEARCYFVKLNNASHQPAFAAEFAGLQELAASGAIRVPTPIATGIAGGEAFLVTEYIAMGGAGEPRQFGRQLAQLHQNRASSFGWHRNNTIGATPQINQQESDWVSFLQRHRFGYQLQLAQTKAHSSKICQLGERLLEVIPQFFTTCEVVPSLLHGDLWSGNYGYDTEGAAVIFDPAVYYGDREADIAMTELFGGFDPGFYAGYKEVWPLVAGYPVRKQLYNLYHIINHFNLFGGGYGPQAERVMQQLLSEGR
jgi:protein-ribulosamine 3-kinase